MKRGEIDPITGITAGKMRTMLKSAMREVWGYTSKRQFINSVRRKSRNPKTNRQWFVVDCVDCGREMGCSEKEKRVRKDGSLEKKERLVREVDHVNMITPLTDIRETLGDYWYEMIYGKMEIVCWRCHKIRTTRQMEDKRRNQ